jgi:hypothetical protein
LTLVFDVALGFAVGFALGFALAFALGFALAFALGFALALALDFDPDPGLLQKNHTPQQLNPPPWVEANQAGSGVRAGKRCLPIFPGRRLVGNARHNSLVD